MNRLIILIALCLLSVNAFSQPPGKAQKSAKLSTEETLINFEKQTWELVKRKDLKAFATLVADDFYGIYPFAENITKPKLLEFLGTVELKDYELTDFKTTILGKNAAVVSYKANVRAMGDGKEFSSRVRIVSGWAKRGGKWLGVFYQETLSGDDNTATNVGDAQANGD